jgi:hypothetical protein
MSGADAARPRTPRIILVAIGLLLFAAAAPFIGSFIQDMSPDGQTVMLGSFFVWTFAGIGAGGLGVVCTIVGAWQGPRSPLTWVAILLSLLLLIAVATIGVWLFY